MKREYSKPEVTVVEEGLLEGVFACYHPSYPNCGGDNNHADNAYNGSGVTSVPTTQLKPAHPSWWPWWPWWK